MRPPNGQRNPRHPPHTTDAPARLESSDLPHVPVWVKWVDSSSRHGWHDAKSVVALMTAESLGWLIAEDDKTVTIALSGVFDGSSSHPWGHLLTIPLCSVIDFRKLPQP
jgi:hypothetical protein